MKNILFKAGILAFVLVFGMMVLGCEEDDGGGGGDSDWVNVTSLAQINGKWKYSESQTDNSYEGIIMKIDNEVIYNFNASEKTVAVSQKQIITLSGSGSKFNNFWDSMKTSMPAGTHTGIEDGITYTHTVTVDEAAHKITMTTTMPPETITDEEIAQITSSGMQISKDGTKLKMPSGGGEPEMIFYKVIQ